MTETNVKSNIHKIQHFPSTKQQKIPKILEEEKIELN